MGLEDWRTEHSKPVAFAAYRVPEIHEALVDGVTRGTARDAQRSIVIGQ
jgi:hypothetical protein